MSLQKDALLRNLQDAGCTDELIGLYMQSCEGSTQERLQLLAGHRIQLLNSLHREQKRLDCLDYLIYNLRKEGTENDL